MPATSGDPPQADTLETRRGFDGAWIHVRVDRVRLPSGRITTRETVEHSGSVAIVGVTSEGEVLLLRQSHHTIGQTLLGLPAGTLAAPMKARLPPSLFTVRRTISGSPRSGSTPCS